MPTHAVVAMIPGYTARRILGRGSMGEVLLAEQSGIGRLVALKRIPADARSAEATARLRHEGTALARMSHPNVVAIWDIVIADDGAYLVMEYVAGPSLREVLDGGPLTIPQALRVLRDISSGLQYAGSLGILHRDLKPGNVLLTPLGVAKVADFGLAKLLGDEGEFRTRAGNAMGTPVYMAPEQITAEADIDHRADVYSLGVLAFELLTGQPPFPVVGGDITSVLERHLTAPVPRPSSRAAGFPGEVEAVLLSALDKDRERRPPAGEWWRALAAAARRAWPGWEQLSGLPGRLEGAASTGPNVPPTASPDAATVPHRGRDRPCPRSRGPPRFAAHNGRPFHARGALNSHAGNPVSPG